MKQLFSLVAGCCILLSCADRESSGTRESGSDDSAEMTQSNKPQQAEFADAKYTDMGKGMLRLFESGDIDNWVNSFADSATYQWSSGDSLKGKAAIANYWKDRRARVIDSLGISNDIWFPIKVNTPQKGPDAPGIWLLNWHQVNVKFKNGKRLMFWVHTDIHYNSADKVDVLIQYIDRAPINKALGMK
jgi:hypothetical protein